MYGKKKYQLLMCFGKQILEEREQTQTVGKICWAVDVRLPEGPCTTI
jgi:hypothetical protein